MATYTRIVPSCEATQILLQVVSAATLFWGTGHPLAAKFVGTRTDIVIM